MECVSYVGWATCSRATVMTHYMFSKKKKKGSSHVSCPDDVPYCPDARQIKHIRPDDVYFHPDPSLYQEASVPAYIRPDVSAARPDDVQWSISFRFSFQIQIREDWCNHPDDVDSRLDELIHKARIAIQIHPSGRQSAWSGRTFNRYGNCVFNFNRLDAFLSWSRHALIWYGNCVLKINYPDGHPPWSGHAKPYMEITCSRRAIVRTTVPHRLDAVLKNERFSEKKNLRNSDRTVVRPDSPCPPSRRHPYISLQLPIWTSAYK